MTATEQQFNELISKQAIQEVALRFAQALDTKDWELASSLFVEEVKADFSAYGIPAQTMKKEALIGLYQYSFRNEKLITEHLYTNFLIDIDGKNAFCTFNFIGNHHVPGLETGDEFYLYGQYHDQLEFDGQRWKIKERALVIFYTKGNAAMLS